MPSPCPGSLWSCSAPWQPLEQLQGPFTVASVQPGL